MTLSILLPQQLSLVIGEPLTSLTKGESGFVWSFFLSSQRTARL